MVPTLAEVEGDASMISVSILLALSTILGFVLGIGHFACSAILGAGAVLAPLSAVALQNQGFGALSGIFITVVCLTINQAAYVVGIRAKDGPRLYLNNEPTTNHTMAATVRFAVNTRDSSAINSNGPNSPIRGRLI
jgi:hypothetical protein